MALKVGTTSGIYYAARDVELHSAIRKVGYTLTRGVACMEIPVDVAHEVTYTEGKAIRSLAKKQGVQLNLHGDLAVPMEIPERGEWRDAHDRMIKSMRSAVFLGAHYIDFHSCLNIWLELITYSGRKLSASFVDGEGRFISDILFKDKNTREWFIKVKGDIYLQDVLDRDENVQLSTKFRVEQEKWRKEQTERMITAVLRPLRGNVERLMRQQAVDALLQRDPDLAVIRRRPELLGILNNPQAMAALGISPIEREKILAARDRLQNIRVNPEDFIADEVTSAFIRGIPRKTGDPAIDRALEKVYEQLREQTITKEAEIRDKNIDEFLERKLSDKVAKTRQWHTEEHRGALGMVDGYHIMAHYLYFTQDPVWVAMANEYKDVLKRYAYKPWSKGDRYDYKKDWLEGAWRKAETENDREYKEFFYAAVAGKYLEGHIKKAFEWLNGDFTKKELPLYTKDKAEQAELEAVAKQLIIGLETPDAREPSHAGLYYLFRPRQIYAVVKTIRKTLSTDKVMMIMDYEHLATQGKDALIESREDVKSKPDFGALTISCHSNHPNPLHPHQPLELGDVILYELLYNLRTTGFGRNGVGYMIYERGGGQDPFVHSVDALRLMKAFLDMDPPTPVDRLPLEFFGMKGLTAGDVQRQMQIVRDKAWEPLKDLLEIPEEEWTMLSQTAMRKGKRPEVWKRAEFR